MPEKHSSSTSDEIMAAQDGSRLSEAAAEVAIQIAQSENWRIRGLYVVEEALVLNPYARYGAELGPVERVTSRSQRVAQFKEFGDRTLQKLEARCQAADVPVATEILFGGVPESILKEGNQVQLLTIGRRGCGHPNNPDHLGQHFRRVAHRISRPMLVGGEPGLLKIARLLLAYDGSERAERALIWASRLRDKLKAEITVLIVENSNGHQQSPQNVKQVRAKLEQSGLVDYRLKSREGQPATEIAAAAAASQADLIIMGGYHHPAVLEWIIGSSVDRVLRNTPLPVLII